MRRFGNVWGDGDFIQMRHRNTTPSLLPKLEQFRLNHQSFCLFLFQAPLAVITDTNEVVSHLPLISCVTEKLTYPPLDS